ncbi:hypothetical protein [Phenylobacterium montanum]|uniref:Uncharacterized protein n=1 Tax=Phenylobacterium montanum TaxID=2823693 RepID=A0A975G6G4_9CAUL|nr:hypothetical protein [Caulobacter sp. S6]QUD90926.1 hypothetical protein KCG34_25550 [Caulobacter sp. S6]
MGAVAHALTSPAGAIAFAAALVWAPLTGFPTWPALARGRLASTVALTGAVASFAFAFANCALGRQT